MVSIDYYIGDINYIHKGYGSKIILELIEQVIKHLGYDYALISPNPDNKGSIRCCEKSGFKYVKTVSVPYNNSKERECVYVKKI